MKSVASDLEKLVKAGTFGFSGKGSYKDPCSWSKVKGESEIARRAAEAAGEGESYKGPPRGKVFPLCVVKNSRVKGLRGYTGRFVFQKEAGQILAESKIQPYYCSDCLLEAGL